MTSWGPAGDPLPTAAVVLSPERRPLSFISGGRAPSLAQMELPGQVGDFSSRPGPVCPCATWSSAVGRLERSGTF